MRHNLIVRLTLYSMIWVTIRCLWLATVQNWSYQKSQPWMSWWYAKRLIHKGFCVSGINHRDTCQNGIMFKPLYFTVPSLVHGRWSQSCFSFYSISVDCVMGNRIDRLVIIRPTLLCCRILWYDSEYCTLLYHRIIIPGGQFSICLHNFNPLYKAWKYKNNGNPSYAAVGSI